MKGLGENPERYFLVVGQEGALPGTLSHNKKGRGRGRKGEVSIKSGQKEERLSRNSIQA